MSKWKIGDKVIAPMQFGYEPVHGVIDRIWVNDRGLEMASVNYGGELLKGKTDWMGSWHCIAPTTSLKIWREKMTISDMWDVLMEQFGVSEQTLEIITAINGYSEETLVDVLYAVSGYRDFTTALEDC